eukprot:5936067-Prymnesium_polylepis.1
MPTSEGPCASLTWAVTPARPGQGEIPGGEQSAPKLTVIPGGHGMQVPNRAPTQPARRLDSLAKGPAGRVPRLDVKPSGRAHTLRKRFQAPQKLDFATFKSCEAEHRPAPAVTPPR